MRTAWRSRTGQALGGSAWPLGVVAQTATSQAPRSTTIGHSVWCDGSYSMGSKPAKQPPCTCAAGSETAAKEDCETALGGRAPTAKVSLAPTTPVFFVAFFHLCETAIRRDGCRHVTTTVRSALQQRRRLVIPEQTRAENPGRRRRGGLVRFVRVSSRLGADREKKRGRCGVPAETSRCGWPGGPPHRPARRAASIPSRTSRPCRHPHDVPRPQVERTGDPRGQDTKVDEEPWRPTGHGPCSAPTICGTGGGGTTKGVTQRRLAGTFPTLNTGYSRGGEAGNSGEGVSLSHLQTTSSKTTGKLSR